MKTPFLLLSKAGLDDDQLIGMILKHVSNDQRAIVIDYTSEGILAVRGKLEVTEGDAHMTESPDDYEIFFAKPEDWIVIYLPNHEFDVLIE